MTDKSISIIKYSMDDIFERKVRLKGTANDILIYITPILKEIKIKLQELNIPGEYEGEYCKYLSNVYSILSGQMCLSFHYMPDKMKDGLINKFDTYHVFCCPLVERVFADMNDPQYASDRGCADFFTNFNKKDYWAVYILNMLEWHKNWHSGDDTICLSFAQDGMNLLKEEIKNDG